MSEISKNSCFIDTNIWLYAFLDIESETAKSQKSRCLISSSNIEIVVSTQVINEVCVNLIKKAKFEENQINQLLNNFHLNYQVIDLKLNILLFASNLRKNYSFSFWDSLIVASALEAKVSILYSEDMQNDLVISEAFSSVKIINPF